MLQRGWRRECRQQDSFTKRHNFHPPPFVPEGKQSRPYRKAAEQKWRQEIGRCGKKVSKDVYSRLANTRQVLELLKTSA